MITEDYVSFDTAKLMKEKGFEGQCSLKRVCTERSHNEGSEWTTESVYTVDIPTLQMAMKWLREVQGLNIYVRAVWKDVEVQYGDWESAVVGYNWSVESLLDDTYSKMSIESFLTYEEAAEAAIKYCLENLI